MEGGEPQRWPGMQHTRSGQPASRETMHMGPGETRALAAWTQLRAPVRLAGWGRPRPVGSAISRRDSVPPNMGSDHIAAPTRFLFWTLRDPNSYSLTGKSETSRQGGADVCASPPMRYRLQMGVVALAAIPPQRQVALRGAGFHHVGEHDGQQGRQFSLSKPEATLCT